MKTIQCNGVSVNIEPEYHEDEPQYKNPLRLDREQFPGLGPIADRVEAMLQALVNASYDQTFAPPDNFPGITPTDSINCADLNVIAEELVGHWGLSKLFAGIKLRRVHRLIRLEYSSTGLVFAVAVHGGVITCQAFLAFTHRATEIIAAHGFAPPADENEKSVSISGASKILLAHMLDASHKT